jgi:hypothetical protein
VDFVGEKIIAHNRNLQDLMKEVDAKGLRKKLQFFWFQEKMRVPIFYLLLYKKRVSLFRERWSIFSAC